MQLSKIWLNGNELAAKLIARIKESIISEQLKHGSFYE